MTEESLSMGGDRRRGDCCVMSMLVQAIVMASLARAMREVEGQRGAVDRQGAGHPPVRVKALVEKAEPVIEKAGPLMDSARQAVEKAGPAIQKAAPLIEKIGGLNDKVGVVVERAGNVSRRRDSVSRRLAPQDLPRLSDEDVGHSQDGREQVEKVGELLQDAAGRARTRLDQIDRALDNTVAQVEHVSESGEARSNASGARSERQLRPGSRRRFPPWCGRKPSGCGDARRRDVHLDGSLCRHDAPKRLPAGSDRR